MTHPTYIREKARALRAEQRLTIDQIAERLALPRTTIYHWVRDMPVAGWGRGSGLPTHAQREGTRSMQRRFRLLREEAYRDGVDSFAALCGEPTFRDFVCMYIGEGYKRSRNRVSICNSDPAVVKLGCHWIARLAARPPYFRLQYHADQDLDALRSFWGKQVEAPPAMIKVLRKSNSNQLTGRTWRSRWGVLAVSVDDTYLRARIEAWITELKAEWGRAPG